MSSADQERWNERYAQGAYGQRTHPSAFLQSRLEQLTLPSSAKVLDVACGAGRNAIYLAALGMDVCAIDGSHVAIEQGQARAERMGVDVHWAVADLEAGLPASIATDFDLIVMVRFVNLALLRMLSQRLNPGGYLLVEQHLVSTAKVGGPGRAAFRVPRGALQEATQSLCCVVCEEGLVMDPDGKPMALSRLIAQRRQA